MQEDDDLLDRINKVKAIAYQFVCLKVPVRNEDIVMTLLEILSPSYERMMIGLKIMPIKELTLKYMTTFLYTRCQQKIIKSPKMMIQHNEIALI